MADQQPHLLTPHPGDHNPQEPQQTLEKLPIQFDLLPFPGGADGRYIGLSLSGGCSLLLGDGVSDAVDERDEEGKVDSTRDLGAVFDVGGCGMGEKLGQGAVGREEEQLRLHGHRGAREEGEGVRRRA